MMNSKTTFKVCYNFIYYNVNNMPFLYNLDINHCNVFGIKKYKQLNYI